MHCCCRLRGRLAAAATGAHPGLDGRSGGEQGKIHIRERIVRQLAHLVLRTAEQNFLPRRICGRKQAQLAHGKISFIQHLLHRSADQTGCPGDCYVKTSHISYEL